jgi:hypothetical protein
MKIRGAIILVLSLFLSTNTYSACGKFSEFYSKFSASTEFQLKHTKFPYQQYNSSICTGVGVPKPGSGVVPEWCNKGGTPKEKMKNGVMLTKEARVKSKIREEIFDETKYTIVQHICDPSDRAICGRVWRKYYFNLSEQSCWELAKEEFK